MKRYILLLSFCFGLFSQLFAQFNEANYETIILKDGSTICGFLKSQKIQKKDKTSQYVQIYAKKIVRTISDSLIMGNISDNQYSITQVEMWWQDWFDTHKNFIEKKDGKEIVTLNRIVLRQSAKMPWGTAPENVKVLERGTQIKYVEFPYENISIEANLIEKIVYPAYNDDILTGLEETVYTRNNRSYSGHLSYLIPGKMLGIFLTDKSNQIVNISLSEIQRRIKKGRNVQQKMKEQSSFVDIIETVDGRILSGVITGYDYGTQKESPYITILHNSGLEHIFLNKIKILSKAENGDYKPVKNIKVQGNNIMFNDTILQFRKPASYKDDLLVFDNDSLDLCLDNDKIKGQFVIYLNDLKEYKKIALIPVRSKTYRKRDIRYEPSLKNCEKLKGIGSISAFVYQFEDIVKNSIDFTEEKYPSGAVKRIYKLNAGNYILYSPLTDNVVLIKLK